MRLFIQQSKDLPRFEGVLTNSKDCASIENMKYTKVRIVSEPETEKEVKIGLKALVEIDNSQVKDMIKVRQGGEFKGKAYFLSSGFDWQLGEDSVGLIVLIPTKKEGV